MGNKILLVEPEYKTPYPPLGLMKISTWHKQKGDLVDFVKFNPEGTIPQNNHYDLIYITSLFTYQTNEVIKAIRYCQRKYPHAEIKVGGLMASLLPDYVKEKTGITPHIGVLDGVEDCSPDYSLFPDLRYSITFTTRGCKRRCKYCAVSSLEPIFFVKEHWERDIDPAKNKIIFWDNNWFFSPNFTKDIEKLKEINKPFDFNQGLDCRLFDSEKARLLAQTKIRPLRFAFDNPSQEGYIQDAIELAKKDGLKDIRVYVLYNTPDENDTPEYFFYRINEINKLGALSFPMQFRPLDIKRRYVSPNWNQALLRGLKLSVMFYYTKGMITKSRKAFTSFYGEDEKQFIDKLYKTYEHDKELRRQRFGNHHND